MIVPVSGDVSSDTPDEPDPPGAVPAPLILLGAGASVDAGIPASYGMTQALVERVGVARFSQTAQALNFVCGALTAYDASGGSSPFDGLDVERVFAAVQLLSERRTLEVTPFVSSWHPAVDAWDRPSLPSFVDRNIKEALVDRYGGERIRDEIVRVIEALTGGGDGRTYNLLAREMVRELRRLVATTAKQVDYLAPLLLAARRPGGLSIATLNYDLAIERAGSANDVTVDTGIGAWIDRRTWSWAAEGVRLLKLHGSIDWLWEATPRELGQMPARRVVHAPDHQEERGDPVLVFGQRGKLRAEGPFLSLLGEFELALRSTELVVAIGYSFRDEHINETLVHWTRASERNRIVLVDPALQYPAFPGGFRGRLLQSLNPHTWSNRPAPPPRVAIVPARTPEALRALFPLAGDADGPSVWTRAMELHAAAADRSQEVPSEADPS